MKLLPSFSGLNKTKDDFQKSAQFVDVEGLNGSETKVESNSREDDKDLSEVPWKELTGLEKFALIYESVIIFFMLYAFVFCVMALVCMPSSVQSPNPHPTRHVLLNKTKGGYGIELSSNKIVKILSGGSADLQGDLAIGDEILSVNGIEITHHMSYSSYVIALMNVRDDDVRLTVVAEAPQVPPRSRFFELLKLALLPSIFIFFVGCALYPEHGPTRTVTLAKMDGGYGMEMKGSTVREAIAGGAADTQGNIKSKDAIVSINGVDTYELSTKIILQLLDTRADDVTLVVRSRY